MKDLSARHAALTTKAAQAEASYRADIDNLKRLVRMLERRDETANARLNEVEREWTTAQTDHDEQTRSLEADLAREHARGDELEQCADELRQQLESAQTGLADDSLASPRASTPGPTSRFFGLSPIAALAAKSQKSGRSYTEINAEHVRLQEELVAERAEVARVNECLASVLAEIEERAALLREQRAEYERVLKENDGLPHPQMGVVDKQPQSDRPQRTACTALCINHMSAVH